MTRHVHPQRQRHRRLVLAPLDFAEERFSAITRELSPLFKGNWEEMAVNKDIIPLDPHWDAYFQADANEALCVTTARDAGTRALVGYIISFVTPSLHYASTIMATNDIFWLDPRYRRGWAPVKMFIEHARALKDRGAKLHVVNFKLHFQRGRVGKLLSRLGYKPIEIAMQRVL